MSKRKKITTRKTSRTGKFCVAMVMLFMVIVMAVQIVTLYKKSQDYSATEEALTQELLLQQMRQEELKDNEEYVGSDEYTEQQAQSKLGLIKDNEIIFRESN